MDPTELQMRTIAKGVTPITEMIYDNEGKECAKVETTDDVHSIITVVYEKSLGAYAYLKWRHPESLDIRDLHVEEMHRGVGLGTILLDRIIEWAREASVTRIWGGIVQKDIDESPFLLDWYQRHGFTIKAPENHSFLPVVNKCSICFDVGKNTARNQVISMQKPKSPPAAKPPSPGLSHEQRLQLIEKYVSNPNGPVGIRHEPRLKHICLHCGLPGMFTQRTDFMCEPCTTLMFNGAEVKYNTWYVSYCSNRNCLAPVDSRDPAIAQCQCGSYICVECGSCRAKCPIMRGY